MADVVTIAFNDQAFGEFLRDFPKDGRTAALFALNDAGKVGQKRLVADMSAFTFRSMSGRRFMERQVKLDFYKRGGAELVRLHSAGPNEDPSRRLLNKFAVEGGGTKVGKDGGSLAVPIKARTGNAGRVPDRYRIATLGLVPGPNGTLISTKDKRIWADHTSVKRRVGGKNARVEVLWSWRKVTRTPTPMRWTGAGQAALEAWPAIAEKAVMEKAAHLLRKGRMTTADMGFAR